MKMAPLRTFFSLDFIIVALANGNLNASIRSGEGGGQSPGEFDIIRDARVKFPTPGQLIMNVKF